MMAQKRGMALEDYAMFTTFSEFLGEVSAWYSSFMTPINTIMGAFTGGEGSSSSGSSFSAPSQPTSSRMRALKAKYAGKKANFIDLETPQGQTSLLHGRKIHGLSLVDKRLNTTPAAAKRLF
jgi:hypothetical protein